MYQRSLFVGLLALSVVGAQTPPQHSLVPLVDGSKTPDQIPDDLAYRHFILAIAEHQNPSQHEYKRRDTRLDPIGFSKQDHDSCIFALAGLREELDAIEADRKTIQVTAAPGDPGVQSRLTALKSQEGSAIAKVRSALRGLSAAGQALLENYIKVHVKTHIVILGSTP